MTLLSSSSRSTRSQSLLPLLFLVTAISTLSSLGCEDKHIGRPCMTGIPADPNSASVNPQALECPSRICLLPARQGMSVVTAGAMCTDYCSGDDDCSDAEKYDSNTNPTGCRFGFACRIPIGALENPIACKRVCVCKDFLTTEDAKQAPPPPPSCH